MLRAISACLLALAATSAALDVYFSSPVARVAPGEPATRRLAPRVVLVVIDGLRHDTALVNGAMPWLRQHAAGGASGIAWTGPVTMTGVGVRALATGVPATVADVIRDLDQPRVRVDNLLASVQRSGGHVALVGHHVWRELFGEAIAIDDSAPRMERLLQRINPVYGADGWWIPRAHAMLARRDWDLFVLHLRGVDDASHLWTPHDERFGRKVALVDRELQRLVEAVGADTTWVITSDHGTGERGHHGSGEPEARKTPLVMLGPAIRAGVRLDARQIDVAPTVAALLGVALPAASRGRVLVEGLAVMAAERAVLTATNALQLRRYAAAHARLLGVEAPTFATAGVPDVAGWIETVRGGAERTPVLWTVALGIAVLALLAGHRVDDRLPWLIAGGLAVLSCALRPTHPAPAALALAAVMAGTWPAVRRSGLQAALRVVIPLAATLALLALWPYWAHEASLQWSVLVDLRGLADEPAALALAMAAALALGPLLRRRSPERWLGFGALLPLAAMGVPAVVIGAAVVVLFVHGRARSALAVIALVVIAVVLPSLTRGLPAGVAPAIPLALALIGCISMPAGRGYLARAALLGLGAAGSIVVGLGHPPLVLRALLVASAVAGIAWQWSSRPALRVHVAAFSAAIVLGVLASPARMPGVVALTIASALAGRALAHGRVPPLALGLVCAGLRMAFFALFEGAMSFSRLDVGLGYLGNPGQEVAFGALLIGLRFVLPALVCAGLVTAHLERPLAGRAVWAWGLFLLLRLACVTASISFARGTYFVTHDAAGDLLYTLALAASLPLAILPVFVGPAVCRLAAAVRRLGRTSARKPDSPAQASQC